MHLRGLWIACAPESDRSRSARSSASGPALYHWVRMPRTGGKRHGDRPGDPSPSALVAGVCPEWSRVLRRPNSGALFRRDRPGRSDRAGRRQSPAAALPALRREDYPLPPRRLPLRGPARAPGDGRRDHGRGHARSGPGILPGAPPASGRECRASALLEQGRQAPLAGALDGGSRPGPYLLEVINRPARRGQPRPSRLLEQEGAPGRHRALAGGPDLLALRE
jgi:hypothetical protein